MSKVGYRTGKLLDRKSDYMCQFTGGNRSTGYFGTGYYFCTKPENCITLTREKYQLVKLHFKDNLKWLRGTIDRHDLLKRINAFVVNFDILKSKEQLDNVYWLARKANELCYYNNPRSELFIAMQDAFETSRSMDFCTDFKSFKEGFENRDWRRLIDYIAKIPELQYLTDILSKDDLTSDDFDNMNSFVCKDNNSDYFYLDYIDSMRDLYRHVTFKIEFEFDLSKEDFFAWAEEAHQFYEKHKHEAVDSISTLFLKALGYDGVWPAPECDDTTYGGVIFERENIESIETVSEQAKDYLPENYQTCLPQLLALFQD